MASSPVQRLPRKARAVRRFLREAPARRALARAPAPVVIGGSGGSGTRAFVEVLERAGVFMGSSLSRQKDAQHANKFNKKWVPVYLASGRTLDPEQTARFARNLEGVLINHRDGIPDPKMAWGIKSPRLMLLLPLLHRALPGLRFLHVIRDGRDMAFSENQLSFSLFGDLVVDPRLLGAPEPVRSIAYWSETNLEARAYGEAMLGDRYLPIRYEDLCFEPQPTVARMLTFAGVPDADVEQAAAPIRPSSGIGRYRMQNTDLLTQLLETGKGALSAFGYLDATAPARRRESL